MMNSLHSPVKLSAGTQALTEATHAGRMLIVPNQTGSSILTLPTPKIGMIFNLLMVVLLQMHKILQYQLELIIHLFFLGSIFIFDTDNAHSVVYSDNAADELITLVTPFNFDY